MATGLGGFREVLSWLPKNMSCRLNAPLIPEPGAATAGKWVTRGQNSVNNNFLSLCKEAERSEHSLTQLSFIQNIILIIDAVTDIDECTEATDPCAANAKCKDTIGSYDCECHKGFSGDGYTCTGRK